MPTPTVLVADDELDIRVLLGVRLRRLPVELRIEEAEDGDQALTVARQVEPDVVVLDHRMPGRTGSEVAALLREEWPEVPIAIFSAYLQPELREEVAAHDVACFPKTDLEGLAAWVGGHVGA